MADRTPSDERSIIKDLDRNYFKPRAGDTWFLIPAKWYDAWKDYVSFDADHSAEGCTPPTPIDMSDIVENGDLRPGLKEMVDFVVVSPQVKDKFVEWYGGDEPIGRRVIRKSSYFETRTIVEFYPLSLFVCTSADPTDKRPISASRADTVGDFRARAAALFGLSPDDVRLWDYIGNRKAAYLPRDTQELRDARLIANQTLMLELRGPDGEFPPLPKPARANMDFTEGDSRGGLVGLRNLGNTCFMNSGLQCLLHSPPLVNYFLSGEYRTHVNKRNVLGSGGEILEEFASLVRVYWSGRYTMATPSEFKAILGKHAEQFSGYEQHDSQELLSYLLDNIHEDANRVVEKPATDRVVSSGDEDDAVIAAKAWETYLARNQSIIVDTMQSQCKSRLQCPTKTCGKVSVTFDPTMYLSVPLPTSDTVEKRIYFNPAAQACIRHLRVTLPRSGTMDDAREAVSRATGVPLAQLSPACDIYNGIVYTVFGSATPVSRIGKHDVVMVFDMGREWAQPAPTEGDTAAPASDATDEEAIKAERRQERLAVLGALRQYAKSKTLVEEAVSTQPAKDELLVKLAALRELAEGAIASGGATDDAVETATLRWSGALNGEGLATFDAVVDQFKQFEPVPEEEVQAAAAAGEEDDIFMPDYTHSGVMAPADRSREFSNNGWHMLTVLHQEPARGRFFPAGYPILLPIQHGTTTGRDVMRMLHTRVGDRCIEYDVDAASFPVDLAASSRTRPTDRGRAALPTKAGTEEPDWDAPVDVPPGHVLCCRWHRSPEDLWLFNLKEGSRTEKEDFSEAEDEVTELSLSQCLERYCLEETLGAHDTWYCPGCKEHVQAHKKVSLWSTPQLLIVHLKRFQLESQADMWYGGGKIDTLVSFPLQGLDLRPYAARPDMDPAPVYDLYAVSNHFGGAGGGHYTASAVAEDGKWYEFDDSRVSEIDPRSVVSRAAYVLFYKRRDVEFPSSADAFDEGDPRNAELVTAAVEQASAARDYSYSNYGYRAIQTRASTTSHSVLVQNPMFANPPAGDSDSDTVEVEDTVDGVEDTVYGDGEQKDGEQKDGEQKDGASTPDICL